MNIKNVFKYTKSVFFGCQKDANKKKVTQTTKNDERTAKTHKNPNGNPRPKSQRETNTHDDDKENQSIKSNQNKGEIHH